MSHTSVAASPVAERARTGAGPKEPKDYVGKRDLSEALVVDCRHLCDTEQIVTVEWPDAHDFYTLTPHTHSPLLFTESVRQALAVSCHTAQGVPMDYRLGWEYLRSDVVADALRTAGRPTAVRLRVVHSAVKRRRLGSVQLVAHVEGTVDGAYAGSAEIHYSAHPGVIYDRLRGPYADARAAFRQALPPTPAVSPERVRRLRTRDVVISPTGEADRWRMRVDTSHSVLYDHPHDHIPGMVLLEAAGQAAQARLGFPSLPVGFDTAFDRYVEFDAPCWLTTTPLRPDLHGRPRVRVDAHQRDRRVFTAAVTLAPTPAT
ncbi:ScbA/BarX family gamma-butyrolactone biosynthesis protein [Streptomyces sp. UNOC14_S4]|uniref:ScbA/BarX family gamma-butyrolactone biosynthesis protein n=1 Tax=Streptomyces sp. UNOC14_S4 TaxID=2872340 RepID=UPI001E4C1E09|nr:ScbA/BarX family gamma-butyrolactone biosynthesis protein [Streptomyces sp. UNOC14_S4]MCC3771741.1 hypothetical protein [Streptomyces sp. UNOC14_S4]